MSTIKVDSIKSADGNTNLLTLSNGAVSGVIGGRRNLIINGAMQVWQRGTSGSATDNYASADRWKIARGTLSQQTFTAGSELGQNRNYANFDFSSSVFTYVSQPIEDVSTVAGKTITVSFYIKSNTLSNVYFHTYSQYGSGGSSVVNDKNFEATSITSSWQRITKTFDVTSLSGKTVGTGSHYFIGIYGSLGTALTGDFDIWGFQVEVGSVATPFEHRSYGEELALCQRYYQSNTMYSTTAHDTAFAKDAVAFTFPTTMRATPSVSFNLTKVGHIAGITSSDGIGISNSGVVMSWNSSNSYYRTYMCECTGTVSVDAEL